jgi:hypothetical protein
MLHLFKKTYLDIDSFIDPNLGRIVISKVAGNPLSSKMELFYVGRLFAHGHSVSDVIGADKIYTSFADMLDFCFNYNEQTGKKLVIYCDKESYAEIAAMWFKTIFVNIDASSAYRIVSTYFNKQILITTPDYNRPHDQDNYVQFNLTEQEFTQTFNNVVTPTGIENFLTKSQSERSIEYLLASYYFNGSHKDQLKGKVKLMMNRYVQDFMRDCWKTLVYNIGNARFREFLGLSTYNVDDYASALNDVRLNSLKIAGADNYQRDDWEVKYNLNLATFTDPQVQEIKELIAKITISTIYGFDAPESNSGQFPQDLNDKLNLFVNILKYSQFSDQDFDRVINAENLLDATERFWAPTDVENINIFLVDYFVTMKKQNQQALLSTYLLK